MSESGSTYGQRLDHNESTQSLLSRRGSEFGNRYVQVDDTGIYLSSLAVTILVSALATVGILLFTLVITLAMLLGSCQSQPMLANQVLSSQRHKLTGKSGSKEWCNSYTINWELDNIQGGLLPEQCEGYVAEYMHSGQYYADVAAAAEAAKSYLRSVNASRTSRDALVFDIDETLLSNLPYYVKHRYGVEAFNGTSWDSWVDESRAVPLQAMVSLYKELLADNWSMILITGRPESQRNSTEKNLRAAGYHGWVHLHLRLADEEGKTAVAYKSRRRLLLEQEGYRVRAAFGDQWSDLRGPAAGNRTFKIPNPMYYIF